MNIYQIDCGETDWVKAHNAVEAWSIYCTEYGVNFYTTEYDMELVTEPWLVFFETDEVDCETVETVMVSGQEILDDETGPHIIATTGD
jgi:hypothetical protein